MGRDLPSGTVSFLFTDVEGSTTLLQELGSVEYAEALATHRRVLRGAFHLAKIRDQTVAAVRPQLDEATFDDEWRLARS